MVVRKVLPLRGPNVWTRVPVLEVWVDAGESSQAGFSERARSLASRLASRSGASDNVRARVDQFRDAEGPVESLARLVLAIQVIAGEPVDFAPIFGKTQGGTTRFAVGYHVEEVALAALDLATAWLAGGANVTDLDVEGEIQQLQTRSKKFGFGPNTAPVVAAARARGIPVRRLNSESLIQLGYGNKQRRFQTAVTDRTSSVAESISDDKDLTKMMLSSVGVPVPEGRPVTDAEDAWAAAVELGGAVVVKPRDADHGDGITLNLKTREHVLAAYNEARNFSSQVMVERYAPGAHHRLLVIGDRVVAAARRDSAHVIGDGRRTVLELIEHVNLDPRRGTDASSPLKKVVLDPIALEVLAEQGFDPQSVPPDGLRVFIRRNSHMKDGGDNVDVTDLVHPEVAARALDAVRVIGLDLAGLDVVAEDIGRPLEEQGGVILEVNANPWLRQHLAPWNDPPRPVGEAIVGVLFPDGEDGRIPIVAVTGTSGKTTTTRVIAHLLAREGKVVGMSSTDGIYVAGRRIATGDCSGPQSAHTVFLNPDVEVAALETAQGGIIREGLAFDRCDVAVVTNLGEGDHLELRGIDTLDELARVKTTVVQAVAPGGVAVLKADDDRVAAMASECRGEVIWFSRDPDHPRILRQWEQGGRALFVREGAIVLLNGGVEEPLVLLSRVPLTYGGRVGFQVENTLAATGAVWALGLSIDAMRYGLESFAGDPDQMPARFNVWEVDGATVVVDFPHNAMALEALVESAERIAHERRVIVFAGCNRRDADVVRQGEILGDGFDRVILYEDQGNQDRRDGELNALLREGFAGRGRAKELVEVVGELEAIELALRELRPGDLLILGVERIEASLEFIRQYFATNAPIER